MADERGGDSGAELGRIGEILQHGHEAEHRADDAESRRVDAGALEHLRRRDVGVLAHAELHVHGVADRLGLAAIDHELQRFLHERVGLLRDQRLEPEQPLLARGVAPVDDLGDDLLAVARRRLDDPREDLERVLHHRERRLDAGRRDRADAHHHEGLGGDERHEPGAAQHGAEEHGVGGEHQSDDAQDVHRRPLHAKAGQQLIHVCLA